MFLLHYGQLRHKVACKTGICRKETEETQGNPFQKYTDEKLPANHNKQKREGFFHEMFIINMK